MATRGADLVRAAMEGDEAAFTELVERHHRDLQRVAYVICRDPALAEDAAQAAWTIAWRRIGLCEAAGGPFTFAPTKPGRTHLGLEEAHRELHIAPDEFDEVAAELGRSLDHFNLPARERGEVLAAFAAHKGEVTEGSKSIA